MLGVVRHEKLRKIKELQQVTQDCVSMLEIKTIHFMLGVVGQQKLRKIKKQKQLTQDFVK